MPLYSVKTPSGRVYDIEGPPGATQAQVLAEILRQYPEEAQPKQSGVVAQVKRGFEQLGSQARTGIAGLLDPNKAAEEGLQRGEEIDSRYAEGPSLDAIVQKYQQEGVGPAAMQALRQAPEAIAGVLPSSAASIGAGIAGAKLGTLAGGPVGGAIGAALGAFGASALPQFGGNIERQAQEQQKQGASVAVDTGKAGAAAVAQGALDAGAMAFTLGGQIISKLTNVPLKALAGDASGRAAKIAEQRLLETLAKEGTLKTIAKGTAKGVLSETPTEVIQQMLERAQAGLPLTDEEAIKEYGETAYQAVHGAPLGALGRVSERSAARDKVEEDRVRAAQQQRIAAEKEEAARKESPEYAAQVQQQYEAMQKRVADLKAITSATTDKNDLAGQQAKSDARKELAEIYKTPEYGQTVREYRRLFPKQAATVETPAAPDLKGQGVLEGFKAAESNAPEARDQTETAVMLERQGRLLQNKLEELQQQGSDAAQAGDAQATARLTRQFFAVQKELEAVANQLKPLQMFLQRGTGATPTREAIDTKIERAQQKLKNMAGAGFDPKKAAKLAAEIEQLQGTQVQDPIQEDLFQPVAGNTRSTYHNQKPTPQFELEEQEALDAYRAEAEQKAAEAQEWIKTLPERAVVRDRIMRETEEIQQELARAAGSEGLFNRLFDETGKVGDGVSTGDPAPMDRTQQQLAASAEERRAESQKWLSALSPKVQKEVEALRRLGKTQKTAPPAPAAPVQNTGPRRVRTPQQDLFGDIPFEEIDRRKTSTEPLTKEGLSNRIDQILRTRDDITPDVAVWLDRLDKGLPKKDVDGVYDTIDEQLRLIEEGKEGVDRAPRYEGGKPKRAEETTTTTGTRAGTTPLDAATKKDTAAYLRGENVKPEAVVKQSQEGKGRKAAFEKADDLEHETKRSLGVQQRTRRRGEETEDTMRGPSARRVEIPKSLSLAGKITPSIQLTERAKEEDTTARKQRELFPENAVKATPAAFREFLKSAPIRKLREQAAKNREIAQKYGVDIEKIRAQLSSATGQLAAVLSNKYKKAVAQMRAQMLDTSEKVQGLLSKAQDVKKERQDTRGIIFTKIFWVHGPTEAQTKAFERAKALALEHMQALGDIDTKIKGLEKIKEGLWEQREKMPALFKSSNSQPFIELFEKRLAAIDGTIAEMQKHKKAFETSLDVFDKLLKHAAVERKLSEVETVDIEQIDTLKKKLAELSAAYKYTSDGLREAFDVAGKAKSARAGQAQQQRGTKWRNKLRDVLSLHLEPTPGIKRRVVRAKTPQEMQAQQKEAVLLGKLREEDLGKEPEKRPVGRPAKAPGKTLRSVPVLRQMLHRLDKQLDTLEANIRARYASSAAYLPSGDVVAYVGAGEKFVYLGQGADTKRMAAMVQQYEALENELYWAVQQEEAGKPLVREITPADRKVAEVIEATGREAELIDIALEEAQTIAARKETLDKAQAALDDAIKAGNKRKTAIEKLRAARDEAQVALHQGLRGLKGPISQLVRIEYPGAPNKLRTGTAESKASPGSSLRPLYEKRAEPQTKLSDAVASGNKASKERAATGKASTQEQPTPDALVEKRLESVRGRLADLRVAYYSLPVEVRTAAENGMRVAGRDAVSEKALSLLSQIEGLEKERAGLEADYTRETAVDDATDDVEDTTPVRKSGRKEVPNIEDEDLFSTNMRERTTPLSKDAVAELEAENLPAALNIVAQTSRSSFARAVAQRLKMLLGDVQVNLVDELKHKDGSRANGAASSDGRAVWFDRELGLNEETLLHEAAHAATEVLLRLPETSLTTEQLAAKKELQRMFEAVRDNELIVNEDAKQNLSEFIAEGLSDPTLQAQMSIEKWSLGSLWAGLKRGLLKLLGIRQPENMLGSFAALTDTLFVSPTRFQPTGKTALNYRKPRYAEGLSNASKAVDAVIAKERGVMDRVKAGGLGLEFEAALVDRWAPLAKVANEKMDKVAGLQMMYYARNYDQKMHFIAQAVSHGAPVRKEVKRADGRSEFLIESEEGPSLRNVVLMLRNAPGGDPEANSRLFSLYLVAKRAANKGLERLNYSGDITQEMLDDAMREIRAVPGLDKAFSEAAREYNDYNKGLLDFAVQSGAISKRVAAKLMEDGDYVPFYRERNSNMEMLIGNETIVRIGSTKEQPYLQRLKGGDTRVLDFMTSSVQNTNMLVDLSLRNMATKSAAFELQEIGLARIKDGHAVSGPDVVHFKVDGEDKHAVIDTGEAGVDPLLLVKGMEGVPFQTTAVTNLLSFPARVLRKAVTLSPVYAARQLYRDGMAVFIGSGSNTVPVLSAIRQFGKEHVLERRGVVGGQVFTGDNEDLTRLLKRMQSDPNAFYQLVGKMEAMSIGADAATRKAQYNSYREQGLSEMEATYMALDAMNFSKHGFAPTMRFLNQVIPFFNAQVQSLNVLAKTFRGKMPFNEKLKIREKLYARGLSLAAFTFFYAMAMQDDEGYKNATPEEKYSNWFVPLPGMDEALKVPIPFELGYIFKALPEAIANMIFDEHGAEDAKKAAFHIATQLVPGGSSFGVPQAMRPAIEAALGTSFYTKRSIENPLEKDLAPAKRVRETTTDASVALGEAFGVSPIKIDHLIRGYTGSMGMAFVQLLSFMLPAGFVRPERASLRTSELPVVGTLFQPKDGRGMVDALYERMQEAEQAKRTFEHLVKSGRQKEAEDFLQKNLSAFEASGLATNLKGTMQQIAQAEAAVRSSNSSPEEKRRQLDSLRQMKIQIAQVGRALFDSTKRQ